MHKIIRDIYSGDICPSEKSYEKTENLIKAKKELDIIREKVMNALIEKYGKKEAQIIEDEWFSAKATIENEEMVSVFKEGFYIGYDIGIAVSNRK